MGCMWVSVVDCSQSQILHLTEMIREDENLQIILSYGDPGALHRRESSRSERIDRLLFQIGMPSHLKGCQYLKTALEICMDDTEELDGITKRLYPDVARRHRTTTEKIEHAIRHAVEAAWKRGEVKAQKKFFGYDHLEGKRPTNLEFIVRLLEYLESEESGRFS